MAHTYSEEELERYLSHVKYPREQHAQDPLETLAQLMSRQIARVPFESLSLHYSQSKRLSLDPDALFQKIVADSKGGYCMELNAFFGGMLRSLGYKVLNVGGRVKVPNGWTGWSHMVNIVTINSTRYAVDVGFGSGEPMQPVPIQDGYAFTQISPRQGKLEYRAISQHSDPDQRAWVYSTREDASAPWDERNLFNETEFFRADYEAMNLSTMTAPTSFFVQSVIAMRGILDEETGKIVGLYTLLNGTLKRQMADSEAEVVATLTTEEERVKAIEEYFFVRLSKLEQRGILGLASQLRG